ncbi:hypothetical protein LASUN_01500 [Lentilactobacillus sunkii]|jgi:hypothetical protein|uniref:Uncharacterized protein n=1 Tax=Lentilactobacillus sunkii TaxID=481719 RepID=A0A1E7XJ74_9LACO|nr:hypothetical protein [Lentilactobacillus sunkii]OFA13151.1 hypothetical protein LASUN_01500 [Lentilactobacillus sunkii]
MLKKRLASFALALTITAPILVSGGVTANAASHTAPSVLRHDWWAPTKTSSKKDWGRVKITKHSISIGQGVVKDVYTGSQMSVKKTGKWYRISKTGESGSANYYRVTKRKIAGKYRTALLRKTYAKSSVTFVYLIGTKVKMSSSESMLF